MNSKLDFIIDLLRLGRKETYFIEIEAFINFIMGSMPQDKNLRQRADKVLRKVLNRDLLSVTYLHRDELKRRILNNEGAISILSCVMQV